MFKYKINSKYNEKEALKQEIDYLSKLINTHVTSLPAQSTRPTYYNRHAGIYKHVPVAKIKLPPCAQRKVVSSFHSTHTKLKNPYKFNRTGPVEFVANKKTSPVTPVELRTKYRLIKNRTKNRSFQPSSKSTLTPRAKTRVACLVKRNLVGAVKSKRKKIIRTQFKLVNSSPKAPQNCYRWKNNTYIRSPNGHKFVLHKTPSCFSKTGFFSRSPVYWNNQISWCRRKKVLNCSLENLVRRRSTEKRTTHLTSINGILYRVSQTKLSREINREEKQQPLKVRGGKVISIFGVKYQMDPSGKTLMRMAESTNIHKETKRRSVLPRIDLGRTTYIQTTPSVWTKTTATDARHFANRVVNRSIHRVLSASQKKKALKKTNVYCMFYNRFGKCLKRETCPFLHDPEKIAVCTRFLRGTCKIVDCPFSHVVAPDKMPVCSYFLQGRCSSDLCPYRHVKVGTKAEICAHFVKGYCPSGQKCKKVHTLDCPQFTSQGACDKGDRCTLRHPRRKPKEEILHRHG